MRCKQTCCFRVFRILCHLFWRVSDGSWMYYMGWTTTSFCQRLIQWKSWNKMITSNRNEVTAADNPTNNDMYEDIEGVTNNQKKKGRKFNIHLHIYKTIIEHNLMQMNVKFPTFLFLVIRNPFDVFVHIIVCWIISSCYLVPIRCNIQWWINVDDDTVNIDTIYIVNYTRQGTRLTFILRYLRQLYYAIRSDALDDYLFLNTRIIFTNLH
jgi:hypothetical protein